MSEAQAAEWMPVRNPRTGRVDHQMPVASPAEVAASAAALRDAQAAWLAAGLPARVQALLAWAQALRAHRTAMVAALEADTGRRAEAALEFDATLSALERWCRDAPGLLADEPARQATMPFVRIEQRRAPYPVVGVISPWNWPMLLSLIDAVPALLVGCAVLIKPSEITPRFVLPLRETLAQVPALGAVLHYVTGGAATGQALVRSVDAVCFTGSVKTGQRVGAAAMEAFIPSFLELGGKDPALVLADADLDRAARSLAWGGMVGAGQSCMSIERVYVDDAVREAFLDKLVQRVGALRHNWPDINQGQIGPIISEAQVSLVQRHLQEALASGARALTGGEVVNHDGGWYCQPTVLVDVTPQMAVMAEETFAAILPVMAFKTVDEAVALANHGEFGLSAAVFSRNLDQARAVAARLHAGAISINDASLTALVHDAAKQSFKRSGLGGSRMGPTSLQRFYRQQALLINEAEAAPWWF
jgi:succinate-semialdehyde dehydrogenase / glutarate-semialdehyde dehydrogenase